MRISEQPPTSIGRPADSPHALLTLSAALVARDETTVLTLFARQPALVHASDPHGNSALHLLVHADSSAGLVHTLLKAGADPMRLNGDGDTALHIAASRSQGNPEVISALLSDGGLPLADQTDRARRTALDRARQYGTGAVVERLIADIHLLERCAAWRQGADGPFWMALVDALDKAPLPTLQQWVMNAGVNATDGRGMTVLMRAADAGRVDMAAWLMEVGANVNATCHCKRTGMTVSALMFALGSAELTRLLIAWGADPMQPHSPPARWLDRPRTVLHVAAAGADPDAMSALLAARPRSKWHDADLAAALLTALRGGAPRLAFAVLEFTGKLDARTMREAMLLAVAGGDRELVHLLIALGAEADARDANGGTALDIAVERGDRDMAALLASHGAATRRTAYPHARRLAPDSCVVQ
jgi:ankyrin repeat protein